MALTIGVDSYLSLVDAETYFAKRIDVASWVAATEIEKEAALATASLQLNNLSWIGTITDVNQSLAFPRNGDYYDPMAGKRIYLDPLVVPNRILVGVCEQAYHLINNDGILDNSDAPSEIKVGPIELKGLNKTVKSTVSPIAKNFFKPLLRRDSSSNMWFRAN
jgi:hypothetical protein